MKTPISKDTIIRTIVLILALANNVLVIFGKSPLPIEDDMINELVSYFFTMGAAVWAWWKNNDFTPEAKTGTALMKEMKAKKKADKKAK